MHRGLEVGIHLTPGVPEENFVATALGNLAGFQLRKRRGEPLEWQILRIEGSASHHFRLVIRHPERALDLGLQRDVSRVLEELSAETVDQLRGRYEEAQSEGLRPAALRTITEEVDLWTDYFWESLGGWGPGFNW